MRTSPSLYAFVLGVLLCSGLVLGPLARASSPPIYGVSQGTLEVEVIDVGQSGPTPGDVWVANGRFVAEDGTPVDVTALSVLTDPRSDFSGGLSVNVSIIVLDFGNSNTLTAAGRTMVDLTKARNDTEVEQVRAVIGGTGIFIGANGEVVSQRQADGTTSFAITFVD